MKPRSRKIQCYNNRFALKFDRHLSSADAEVPVKFQSDWKSLNSNILRFCGKTSVRRYNDVIMSIIASQITSLNVCLLNRLFGRRSKKTSKLCVTGLCVGNSPGTGEFPAQMASNAENVSIWWRHHGLVNKCQGDGCVPVMPVTWGRRLISTSTMIDARHQSW